MRYLLWNMDWFINLPNCYLQLLVSFTFTLIVSFTLALIIGKLPFSKYIIAT